MPISSNTPARREPGRSFACHPSRISIWRLQRVSRCRGKATAFNSGQTLSVQSKFGDIRIHAENSREAKISATIRAQAGNQAEADKYAASIQIEVTEDAHGVNIRTIAPSDNPVVLRIGRKNSYSVDYDIALPSDAKLWVRNGFGNVEIRGIHGWADAENGHGQLSMRDGGPAKLTDAFGSIEVEGAPVSFFGPRDAMARGIGLVPEDRKKQGLFLRLAIRTNL